ncbi:hypothetical protein I7I48_06218 [Histoplasma ohiense]|nr:hypothetical protein I7I48_06218 [Histoplasma ohiense (nom. inval.)]
MFLLAKRKHKPPSTVHQNTSMKPFLHWVLRTVLCISTPQVITPLQAYVLCAARCLSGHHSHEDDDVTVGSFDPITHA